MKFIIQKKDNLQSLLKVLLSAFVWKGSYTVNETLSDYVMRALYVISVFDS